MTKLTAIFLILCAVLSVCGCFETGAYAEAEYNWARVTKNDVYLYADEKCERALFELEKSYYIEVLDTIDNVYMVTVMQNKTGFPSLLGYVRKIEVKATEVTPLNPLYPTEQIVVIGDSAQLKLLPMNSSENVIVATTSQKLSYYGALTYYGKDWYYVYCGGKFGYVEQSAVSKPKIELHPTPLETAQPVIKPQNPDDNAGNGDGNEQNGKTPTAEILLIVFVVLLAGGLTLALFLPFNGRKNEVFEHDI